MCKNPREKWGKQFEDIQGIGKKKTGGQVKGRKKERRKRALNRGVLHPGKNQRNSSNMNWGRNPFG